MRLRNMLKICLVFWKSEPQYAYKRYAYKKKHVSDPMPYEVDEILNYNERANRTGIFLPSILVNSKISGKRMQKARAAALKSMIREYSKYTYLLW